jgi:hypothetical protein
MKDLITDPTKKIFPSADEGMTANSAHSFDFSTSDVRIDDIGHDWVSLKQEQHLVNGKCFQRARKPTVTFSNPEVIDNKNKIVKIVHLTRRPSISGRCDHEKVHQDNSLQDNLIWTKPKRSIIRRTLSRQQNSSRD